LNKSNTPAPVKSENFTHAPAPVFIQNSDSTSCSGSGKNRKLRLRDHLWSKYTHTSMKRLRIAYNSGSQTGATWLTKGGIFNPWEEICSREALGRKSCEKKN